jgi:hypothetical protein
MEIIFLVSNILISFFLGAVVGLAELLSRYSDPYKIFNRRLANYYILLNGLISILGYCFLKKFQGNFASKEIEVNNALMAGLGAMVILRSSIANINHNGKKIEVGLGAILQVFLDSVEKLFNRQRSVETINQVQEVMKGVDFSLAKINLPSLCITSYQNLSKEQSVELGSKIKALSDKGLNHMKSVEFGIILEQYFGIEILTAAVVLLKKQDDTQVTPKQSISQLINKFKN